MAEPESTQTSDPSVGQLLTRLSEQSALLVREELALARAEMTEKATRVGIGSGLFGVAGVLALFGLGVLLAAAVLGLAMVVDAWLAAVIVGAAVLAVAGIAALVGRKEVSRGMPPLPEQTVRNVEADFETVKGARHREDHS